MDSRIDPLTHAHERQLQFALSIPEDSKPSDYISGHFLQQKPTPTYQVRCPRIVRLPGGRRLLKPERGVAFQSGKNMNLQNLEGELLFDLRKLESECSKADTKH